MAKNVVVLDYGSGNLRSAQRAVERTGANVTVTSDFQTALDADGLLVPGVGAFEACMRGLKAVRGEQIIGRRLAGGRPVLGICVGMQILFEKGVEHGVETAGCDEWPGTVEPLDAPIVPHMGWNTVDVPEGEAGCSPGSTRRPGSTSCTPTGCGAGSSRSPTRTSGRPWSVGPPTGSRSSPRWRTARSGPPSSTRRSPATRVPRC